VREPDDLTLDRLSTADALGFVGSTSPQGHVLPLVGALARLRDRGRAEGADLIVVDTSAMVSGIWGQLVKYYKVDMLEPDLVVGLQRGEELEPVLGVIQRFFGVDLVTLPVHPNVVATSVDQRSEQREGAMAAYFEGDLQRFRVKPTVFMPSLPPLFDLPEPRPSARRPVRRRRRLTCQAHASSTCPRSGPAADLARGKPPSA
jgi:polynucleotide 5'-kinase involved in rRNA processing